MTVYAYVGREMPQIFVENLKVRAYSQYPVVYWTIKFTLEHAMKAQRGS
jgi:hypothetical protein